MKDDKPTASAKAPQGPDPEAVLVATFLEAFTAFMASARPLFTAQEDDRILDQLLSMRDRVFGLVGSDVFLAELRGGCFSESNKVLIIDSNVLAVLIEELRAFTRAVEVYSAMSKPEEKKSFWKRLLGYGSTTVGSVKDIAGSGPLVKGGLTVFGELFDLFKG